MAQIEAEEYDPLLGLMVINNCFYKRTDSGKTQLTTFNILPMSVIEYIDNQDSEFTMHATLMSTNKLKMPVVFTQPDWGSKSAFIKKLPHPDFAYLGGDTDVSRLFHVLGQIDVPKKIPEKNIIYTSLIKTLKGLRPSIHFLFSIVVVKIWNTTESIVAMNFVPS
jgi:hypothetical protein